MFINSSKQIQFYVLVVVVSGLSFLSWHLSSNERAKNSIDNSNNRSATYPNNIGIKDGLLTTIEQQLTDITKSVTRMEKRLDMKQDKLVKDSLAHQAQKVDLLGIEQPQTEELDPDIQQELNREMADLDYEEQINSLETQLGKEPVDDAWFTEVEDDVYSAIDKQSDRYVLDDLVCGNSICKLETSMKSINGKNDFSNGPGVDHLIHGDMGWPGQSVFELNTETGKATVYLIREGENITSEEG